MTETYATCANCGAPVQDSPGGSVEDRTPCSKCGSSARAISLQLAESLTIKEFMDVKKKDPKLRSKDKLRIHIQQGDQLNHGTGRWVLKERRIDKDSSPAWYLERVTDPETGTVLHETDESLAAHRGHGSDKKSNRKSDG